MAGGVRTTISTSELRMAAKRIEVEESNRKNIQAKREIVADSLQKYQLAILDLENNVDVAGELGPLEYLSGLTGIPMDKIINYLLLVIIFVFDPLAISLVIAVQPSKGGIAPANPPMVMFCGVPALGIRCRQNCNLLNLQGSKTR